MVEHRGYWGIGTMRYSQAAWEVLQFFGLIRCQLGGPKWVELHVYILLSATSDCLQYTEESRGRQTYAEKPPLYSQTSENWALPF
jgi:hypothetical protein